MNKASKPVKRANLNTSVLTGETALSVGTGDEGGRAAVTATIPSAQIAYQIYQPRRPNPQSYCMNAIDGFITVRLRRPNCATLGR